MAAQFCDRCGAYYQPADGWPRCPLCPACLIGTRRAEARDQFLWSVRGLNDTRPLTAREIEQAWRRRTMQLWHTELAV
jgi:hypothetical protein